MSLFVPRFAANEFAPVFRLLDDFSRVAYRAPVCRPQLRQPLRSFQPRFDVTESRDSYELKGELPGIDQKDIEVEFTGQNTLRVQGRTERHHEEGTRPSAQQVEAQAEAPKAVEAESASETSSYHKATVEEEGYVDASVTDDATMSGGNPEATPAETPKEGSVAETQTQETAQQAKSEQPKYWVSERSVGQFSRSFRFPKRVDQDNVKASLKDGILSVVIAKAAIPENKRVSIE